MSSYNSKFLLKKKNMCTILKRKDDHWALTLMLKIANKDFKVALITMLSNIMENMLEMIEKI